MKARISWVLAGLALALTFWCLSGRVFPTYDDGWNVHLLAECLHGNWIQLWHHGSPLFYLFWLPAVAAGCPYEELVILNALLGCTGLYLLVHSTLTRYETLPIKLLIWCIVLCTPLAQVNLFAFTIEGGGLFLLGSALRIRKPFWKAVFLGLAFLWNYKLIVLGGVAFVFWLWQEQGKKGRLAANLLLGAALPAVLIYAAYVLLNGWHQAWRPLGTYAGLVLRDANPGTPSNAGDVLFHLKYLFQWDAWHIWVLGLWTYWQNRRNKLGLEVWLVLALLLFGLFIPKAPRWLLPALPLVAAGIPRMIERVGQARLQIAIWLSLLYGAWSVHKTAILAPMTGLEKPQIFNLDFLPDLQFPLLLDHSDSLYTYGSTLPYLYQDLRHQVKGIFLQEAPPLPGYHWLDGSGALPGQHSFQDLRVNPDLLVDTVLNGRIGTMNLPILWLEHAEFTGLSFEETMTARQLDSGRCTKCLLVHIQKANLDR